MKRLTSIIAALAAGSVAAVGSVAIAVSASAGTPAAVSYQPPREQIASPASYTLTDQRLRREQNAEVRGVVRAMCSRGSGAVTRSDLRVLCREWHLPLHLAAAFTVAPPGTYDSGIATAIHADGMASATLNATTQVYMAGDASQVEGSNTVGGFDHFELLTEPDGSGVFTPLVTHHGFATAAGLQYQQFGCLDSSCPTADANWSDGTFFWPTGIFTDGSLWVPGVRVDKTGAVHASYMAKFNLVTLAFEGVTQLPTTPAGGNGAEIYTGTVALRSGLYMVATHDTPENDPNEPTCDSFVTDCKIGDMIWIPNGTETSPASWTFHMGVFPSGLNAGTRISDVLDVDGSGTNYNAYSNVCDVCTGNGQYSVFHSSSLLGPWTGTVVSLPVSIPAGAAHYGLELHFADSPAGQILASINVNGYPSGQYDPDFFDLTP